MTVMQNPEVAAIMGFGPQEVRELFNQVYLLRGVTPARLPNPAPAQAVVPGEPGQEDEGSSPAESISIKLPDLAGKERTQALAMFGIRSDPAAHEKLLKLEHPKPVAKNGAKASTS
jgi:hypothetical protein